MRRRGVIGCLSLLALIVLLVACGQKTNAPTWQEQYDLGVRYLSEGDYEEAIIAFTAAIEIDPKLAPAYVGRGDANVGLNDYTAAVADYQKVLELLPDDPESYLRLIEVYETLGDADAVKRLQEEGFARTGDSRLEPPCEHIWKEANYQQPKTCQLCGETEGEPLPASLANFSGYTMMEVGTEYPYQTLCSQDTSLVTTGTAKITNYRVIDGDDFHEYLDGYKWYLFSMVYTFYDENAQNVGFQVRATGANYYEYDAATDDGTDEGLFTVNYFGEEYNCWSNTSSASTPWVDGVSTVTVDVEYQLPVGYDGCMMLSYNSSYVQNGQKFKDAYQEILTDSDTLCFWPAR